MYKPLVAVDAAIFPVLVQPLSDSSESSLSPVHVLWEQQHYVISSQIINLVLLL